jgi:hypothetical protein
MPVAVAVEAVIGTTTTGSAASHRVFAARSRTILRYRERNPTNEQRSDDCKTF